MPCLAGEGYRKDPSLQRSRSIRPNEQNSTYSWQKNMRLSNSRTGGRIITRHPIGSLEPGGFMKGFEAVRWKNRDAIRLSNGIVELVALRGGGHVAAFSLLGHGESPAVNGLWEAPWETREPDETSAEELSSL